MSKQQENPNENCLAGMACPRCNYFGPFQIQVTTSGRAFVSDDGTSELTGSTDTDWADGAYCKCLACGHESTVREFRGKPTAVFDQYQQLVAESYNAGDHSCSSPLDAKDCGDGLLSFLMAELSEGEDCDSFKCAVHRLDSAIQQLSEVRAAFEAKHCG